MIKLCRVFQTSSLPQLCEVSGFLLSLAVVLCVTCRIDQPIHPFTSTREIMQSILYAQYFFDKLDVIFSTLVVFYGVTSHYLWAAINWLKHYRLKNGVSIHIFSADQSGRNYYGFLKKVRTHRKRKVTCMKKKRTHRKKK